MYRWLAYSGSPIQLDELLLKPAHSLVDQGLHSRFLDLLRVLIHSEVDFVIVGGVASVLAGVPLATFDLDIVFARDEGNLAAKSSTNATRRCFRP